MNNSTTNLVNKRGKCKSVMINLLFIVCLSMAMQSVSAQKRKQIHIFKTHFLGLLIMTEPSVYYEWIDLKSMRGFEIGFAYRPAKNGFSTHWSGGFGFKTTDTRGGPYGLDKVWSPTFIAGHKTFSLIINYKYYKRNFRYYVGPQVVLSYHELLNAEYSDHDAEGPGLAKGYYWYTANHYAKKIGLLFQLGKQFGITKRVSKVDLGLALGCNIHIDRLQLLRWGANTQFPDTNFNHYDKMDRTKGTDGVYLRPALSLSAKFGLSKKMRNTK